MTQVHWLWSRSSEHSSCRSGGGIHTHRHPDSTRIFCIRLWLVVPPAIARAYEFRLWFSAVAAALKRRRNHNENGFHLVVLHLPVVGTALNGNRVAHTRTHEFGTADGSAETSARTGMRPRYAIFAFSGGANKENVLAAELNYNKLVSGYVHERRRRLVWSVPMYAPTAHTARRLYAGQFATNR